MPAVGLWLVTEKPQGQPWGWGALLQPEALTLLSCLLRVCVRLDWKRGFCYLKETSCSCSGKGFDSQARGHGVQVPRRLTTFSQGDLTSLSSSCPGPQGENSSIELLGLLWGLSETGWVCDHGSAHGVRDAPEMAVCNALHLSPARAWPARGPA